MRSAGGEDQPALLEEQVRYYRAVAAEYDDHALPFAGGAELAEALARFRPTGSVLELACGPGTWTTHLLRHADDLTAVDASPEMLAIASARVGAGGASAGAGSPGSAPPGSDPTTAAPGGSAQAGGEPVRFVAADLFRWRPDRRYDVVFFGFWLSHVPPDRFESFWSLVAECLKPDGRVFFVDDGYRTADELVEGEHSSTIQRRLTDGTPYRIVKVAHRPADLERQLDRIGWRIKVCPTAGPFFWGAGSRA